MSFETDYIWKNGQLVPWQEATTHVLTHGLHYGTSVFEGIRFYETDRGPAIFKLAEHTQRFYYSAEKLGMKIPYSQDELNAAIVETVQKSGLKSGYIRPLAYYGYGQIAIKPNPKLPTDVIIACLPMNDYHDVRAITMGISPYIRIHPKSTHADAKIGGHYVNSVLSYLAVTDETCQESLLLDYEGNIAECSAANIFFIQGNKVITPPLGTILKGITRSTTLSLARELGYEVVERAVKPGELAQMDGAFLTGTAIEVMPIGQIDDHVFDRPLEQSVAKRIRAAYFDVVLGRDATHQDALTYVPSEATEPA